MALAKSSVVSKYGINAILAPLTNELECLYTRGMTINSPGEFVGNIKPKIFQSIGDNLALNTILGFTTSFSANYFCRFCKTRKADTHHQTVEDKTSLRTQNGIGDDIEVNDVSKTGFKMSSQLNQLSYYHVAENTCPDIMHDFLEGLLPIEMKLVLAELVAQGLFSLQDFNSRLHSFSYGFNDQSNKPSPIPQGKLLNPFGSSGQTSAQMHCLSLYFLLIVGEKVSEGCEYLELFQVLLQIYKLVSAPSISDEGVLFLKSRIKEHHLLFLKLFPDSHLIPKHHHIVHYPRAIQLLGPLSQYSCMRQEAKHKPLKAVAKVCNNYRNITKTLANRHQELQAFSILMKHHIEKGSVTIHRQEVTYVSSLDNEEEMCRLLHCTPDKEITLCGHVKINSYSYRPNTLLLTDRNCEMPSFSQLNNIVRMDSKLLLVLQPWKTHDYNYHYQAYDVSESKNQSLELREHHNLFDHRPVHAVRSYEKTDHDWYIPTRYILA